MAHTSRSPTLIDENWKPPGTSLGLRAGCPASVLPQQYVAPAIVTPQVRPAAALRETKRSGAICCATRAGANDAANATVILATLQQLVHRGYTVACRGTSNTTSKVSAGVGRRVP